MPNYSKNEIISGSIKFTNNLKIKYPEMLLFISKIYHSKNTALW